jgi:hypothetical protein
MFAILKKLSVPAAMVLSVSLMIISIFMDRGLAGARAVVVIVGGCVILNSALYFVKWIVIDRYSFSSLIRSFLPEKSHKKSKEARVRRLPTFADLIGGHFAARDAFSGAILGLAAWAISKSDAANHLGLLTWTAAVLAFLSLAAFVDAALIAVRLRRGQYGLSAVEVKEIGSFAIGRRGNGRGPSEFSGVFGREDAEKTSAEVGGAVVGVRR